MIVAFHPLAAHKAHGEPRSAATEEDECATRIIHDPAKWDSQIVWVSRYREPGWSKGQTHPATFPHLQSMLN